MRLTVIILLVLIPSITTLRCYICNSNEDPRCASNDLDTFAGNCPAAEEPYCRRISQTINKQTSIVRSCGSKIGAKSCYKTAGTNNANVCSCNTDLCNHASSFNRQQQMMTIMSSFVVLAISMIVLR